MINVYTVLKDSMSAKYLCSRFIYINSVQKFSKMQKQKKNPLDYIINAN